MLFNFKIKNKYISILHFYKNYFTLTKYILHQQYFIYILYYTHFVIGMLLNYYFMYLNYYLIYIYHSVHIIKLIS